MKHDRIVAITECQSVGNELSPAAQYKFNPFETKNQQSSIITLDGAALHLIHAELLQ